ncbi:putative bifunctional diguanylate cyclase/phosphodiesterase [Deinococcus peraridilitoris]|uniref:Diguanylate cyclase (GGDEF) domain-containing protein n=1 Tax=Deinococcus peraridilitoris (strain DSM 19664 / LMG 22246 / CIP 109416 / KR-200) TaxID=937777 RepID=L0A0C0_DEIPD|nr:EAL domain-containing protein [Deinococcus peraridilitoris]AFZ67291.1 diguanylate cyclase (GGDEF) domain-containing protein [Deinococcus peraridilitoris DSM 19664]
MKNTLTLPTTLAASHPVQFGLSGRLLLFVLPIIALAFLTAWLLGMSSGRLAAFDAFAYPLMFAGIVALELLLLARRHAKTVVTAAVLLSASGFFLAKLVFLVLFAPQGEALAFGFSQSFLWTAGVFVLSFFLPSARLARRVSFAFLVALVVTSLVCVVVAGALDGSRLSAELLNVLVQLNLACLVFFVLARGSHQSTEEHARAVAHTEAVEALLNADALTGLPNRRFLEAHLQQLIGAPEKARKFSVVYLDLDGFKLINDTLGHAAGDEALQEAALRFMTCRRPDEVVARISGDEFVVVLPEREEQACERVDCFLETLRRPLLIEGQVVYLTASAGISHFPQHGENASELLRHADSAMYHVKRRGRNGLRVFEPSNVEQEIGRTLTRDLTAALREGQFSLAYQPLLDLQTRTTVKVEALLRWTHPLHGPISPATFIPLAEVSGLIVPLGDWVLHEACAQVRRWQEAGLRVGVCVNVAPLQFAQPGFVGKVLETVRAHGIPHGALELELTEGALLADPTGVRQALHELKAAGVRTALDDFGTGYSSLSQLRDLPIQTLKIDRSFVRDLEQPGEACQYTEVLIQAVLAVARTLHLGVVAEGIETEAQLRRLREFGVTVGQGYLFSPPRPAAEIEGLSGHL